MSSENFSILEAVMTIGALVTSAAAVYIAWDQAQVMHADQHASVFPALQIDPVESYSNGEGLTVGFTVENAGVGPAFVRSARLLENSVPLKGVEEITAVVPSGVNVNFTQLTGRVIAPGVARNALTLQWRGIGIPREKIDGVYASTGNLAMEVCYCSTLDRCWISKSGARTHPVRDDACFDHNETSPF